MTMISKAFKVTAGIFAVAVIVLLIGLAGRLEGEDRQIKAGEMLPEQAMTLDEIGEDAGKAAATLVCCIVFATISLLIDTHEAKTPCFTNDEDMPSTIPARTDPPSPPTSGSNIVKQKTCDGCGWASGCQDVLKNKRCEWYKRRGKR